MADMRNWMAIVLGIELLAAVLMFVSPWFALPIALIGVGVGIYGFWPTKTERIFSKILQISPILRKRQPEQNPTITAELETIVSKIGDFTPALAIRITNTGPPLEGKCLVQIENHELKIHMPDPLVIRTEGQIRNKRTGPFTLRAGQPKLVPLFFRDSGRINEFRFIGEDKEHYRFVGDSGKFVAAIYGATSPTMVRIHFNVGKDWKIDAQMEYC